LAGLIRTDIAFSSEILTLANSALFGFRTEITSILQATVLLGLERVKAIALTVGLRSYLTDSLQIPALLACWRHSLACALISEELATPNFVERDVAYVSGLMHDIGRLALTVVEPLKYSNLLLEAEEKPVNILERERELFGADHCEAGRWLAQQWNLPKDLVEVISRHHAPPKSNEFDMVALVRMACTLADCIGFSAAPPLRALKFQDILRGMPSSALKRFALDQQQLTFKVAMKINSVQ
jgi:putative nucleotidyltransferase with HDIG domain